MKRATFLKKDQTKNGDKFHLRFIISDPDPDDCLLVVNMATYHGYPWENDTCILKTGDHEMVVQESYIVYEKTESMNRLKILGFAKQGIIIYKDRISSEVLKRIQDGTQQHTSRLPQEFKKFFIYF